MAGIALFTWYLLRRQSSRIDLVPLPQSYWDLYTLLTSTPNIFCSPHRRRVSARRSRYLLRLCHTSYYYPAWSLDIQRFSLQRICYLPAGQSRHLFLQHHLRCRSPYRITHQPAPEGILIWTCRQDIHLHAGNNP